MLTCCAGKKIDSGPRRAGAGAEPDASTSTGCLGHLFFLPWSSSSRSGNPSLHIVDALLRMKCGGAEVVIVVSLLLVVGQKRGGGCSLRSNVEPIDRLAPLN